MENTVTGHTDPWGWLGMWVPNRALAYQDKALGPILRTTLNKKRTNLEDQLWLFSLITEAIFFLKRILGRLSHRKVWGNTVKDRGPGVVICN